MKKSVVMTGSLVAIGMLVGFFVGRETGGGGTAGSATETKSANAERAGRDGPGSGAAGRRGGGQDGKAGRGAAAAVRKVARELEMSPMASMDFDAMFDAYEQFRWMTPDDVRIALEELELTEGNSQSKMMLQMMLINRWAKQDGQGAVEFAMTQKNPMLKMMGMMGGLMGWAKQDPDNAYDWYLKNRDQMKGGMMGDGGMDGIFFAAFAQRDIKDAFQRLADLDSKTKGSALAMMASQVTMDPARRQEFISELDRLGDTKLRQSAMEGMIGTWAFQDPRGAAEFISSHEWEEGRGKEMRDRLADSWANMDAEASLKWRLENLQQGEDRAAAVASGFSRWIKQDPQEAQKWLETQPEEVRTDSLYTQTADQFRWTSNYSDAAQWAGRIEDQTGREAKLRDIYTAWHGEDSEAAQQWLGGLDERTRAAVQIPAEEMDAPKATESR